MYINSFGSTNLDYYIMGAAGGTYLYSTEEAGLIYSVKHGYGYYSPDEEELSIGNGLKSINFITVGGLILNLGRIKPFVNYAFAYSR